MGAVTSRPPPGWSAELHAAWQAGLQRHRGLPHGRLRQLAAAHRSCLRTVHLERAEGAYALGFVAAAAHATLGLLPHDTQGFAAWLMLRGSLAEMATGEGKTLATGLAAATASLAGLAVHVMTANDYLVRRDRDTLAPLYELLGLPAAAVVGATPPDQRFAAYRCPIVYVTARELVFDHLKDHLQLRGERDPRVLRARAMGTDCSPAAAAPQPLVPRLQQAFIDEADAILLDEASIPFVLSMPGARPEAAALQAARAAARTLLPGDFVLNPVLRSAELTPAGLHRLGRQIVPGSPLWPLRHGAGMVRAVLVAEHLLLRDRDYAVDEQGVQLIDEITGRIATGRQWNHPLHAMVELKEGREPTPPLHTAARVTYQRFFPRYERLGGMSGTLREAAGELKALYRCPVVTVPLARPSRAQWLGGRLFADAASRREACVRRVRELVGQQRPVLVGTDSVNASRALSLRLQAAGIAHQVLNAVQDADEAAKIACAGQAGRVTVATNIAGRGRQLAGRAARHGDPGSAESMLSLDDAPIVQAVPALVRRRVAAWADAGGELPAALAPLLGGWAQRRGEWRERLQRRDLQLLDEQLGEQLAFAGTAE